ncbi:DNA-binding transcriptional regulator, MerR family [Priestia filamentosa]|nr:DNA-binding transcriptional regulator, MerR family [Priestia filamentosa]
MMKELFTIGEISKLFHMKISTLRYYDEIGLLRPQFTDDKTHYRYYSTQQFERLDSIKYLRALGVPISELLEFFNYRDIDNLVMMLKNQQAEIAQKKMELETIERKISQRLLQINHAINTPLDTIAEVKLPQRHVAYLQHDYSPSEDIEFPISELRTNFNLKTNIFIGKIGLSISISDLYAGAFNKYSSVFMTVEEDDEVASPTTIFPSREYLQICFKGTHIDAPPYYKKLMEYMRDHQYKLIDDSMEITLIDYGVTNDLNKYVTEILVPYSRL